MLFFKHLLLFAATSSAVAILPRAVRDVISALTKVDNDVKTLTSQVKAWNGTVGGATPIFTTANTLDSDIKSAVTVINNQPTFNNSDCQTILNYLKTLLADVQACIAALKNRKADCDKVGITPSMLSKLKTLRTDINTLINALKARCGSSEQPQFTTFGNSILASFDDAIKTYGG